MKYPLVCIDNFYPDPMKVRNFALKQKFESTIKGGFSGKRTDSIHKLDINLFNYFCARVFSIFYDFDYEKQLEWTMNTCFDITDKSVKEGWIHTDSNMELVGLLYLTPNSKIESGTSFYSKNNNYNEEKLSQKKIDFFLNKTDEEEYFKTLKEHNNNFTKNLTIGNIFNRLIVYDPTMYHAHDNLLNTEERLIQVFHVSKFNAKMSPLERMRRYD
jgi:hypothetical protein